MKTTSSDTSDQVNRSLCGQCSGLGSSRFTFSTFNSGEYRRVKPQFCESTQMENQ
ncbi:hypothetical protein [Klebsiella phage pKV-BS375-3.1]|nr:hypothetical protein [Klebsiella phage pKV-BS375-3.1]